MSSQLPADIDVPVADESKPGPATLFDDPLAEQILWTTMSKSSPGTCTHRLQMRDPHCLEFRQTLHFRATVFVMLAAGLLLPAIGFYVGFGGDVLGKYALILTGLLFGLLGGYFFFAARRPRVFDQRSDAFQIGYPLAGGRQGALSDVHALQIVSRLVVMEDSPDFYCHDLNLVLKNATRVHVLAHGWYADLRKDAATLGDFLHVPVWDRATLDSR